APRAVRPMRMELDQVIEEFAQTSGASWAANVASGCSNTAGGTEPIATNAHRIGPRFARRARLIDVALREARLEDLAELHLAGAALQRTARVSLESNAALRTMKMRHG